MVLIGVAVLALATRITTRTVLEPGLAVAEGTSFGTFDPDGHYHMRRLERALADGGHIAGRDPLLTAGALNGVLEDPRGTPIPWPSGFTRLLWLAATPFAPKQAGPERDAFVEVFVGSSGVLFGVLQALVAAIAAACLVGGKGGLTAAAMGGGIVALAPAALRYSFLGMGDHHALASGLMILSLLLLDGLVKRNSLGVPVVRTLLAAGVLAFGVSVWLPCLILLGMGVLFFGHTCWRAERDSLRRRDVARTALLYFCAVALFLVPMGLTSPWPADRLLEPSLLQALLAGGLGLSFLSLAFGSKNPWVLRGILVLAVGGLFMADVPREAQAGFMRGLAWLSARDEFMGVIGESRAPGAALLNWTGPGLLLALAGLFFPWRKGLLLWRLMFLGALLAACMQVRFTESLIPLMGILAGVALGSLKLVSRRPLWASVGSFILLLAVHGWLPHGAPGWTQGRAMGDRESATLSSHRSMREACVWLREQPDPGSDWAVLAQWDLGHGIEWLARRRTLASNFGAYLGRDVFRAPWIALASTDDEELRESLEDFKVSHLLVTSRWQRNLVPWLENLAITTMPDDALVQRLQEMRDVPGYLQLVHQSPRALFDRVHPEDPHPQPGARIYRVVAGANLVAKVNPGDVLQVALPLVLPDGHRLMHRASAKAGPDGEARVRWPYPSGGEAAGDVVGEELRWSCGGLKGSAQVTERDVQAGRTVLLFTDS